MQLSSLRTFIIVLLVLFSIIIGRLLYLQIYTSLSLLYRSKHNYVRYESILSPRGAILDCKGRQLATNRPIISLIWQGTGNRRLSSSQKQSIDQLLNLLALDCKISDLERQERQRRKYTFIEELTFNQLGIIMEQFPDHTNIRCETRMQRYYPGNQLACHVLGYITLAAHQIGSSQRSGVMGLECAFDVVLRGIPGQMLTTINSCGHHISQQELNRALAGETVRTTIDIDYQTIAEECFPKEERGVILMMEAATGALRVVLSRPGFDPNLFTHSVAKADWQGLLDNQAFLNRAFSACYPPASLFKLVTMIAALDTHIITPTEMWYCPGYTVFAGRPYACMNRRVHGYVTIEDAISKSCNIPFYEIACKVKINTLASYAQWLGLGASTNNIIGDKAGLIPTTHWKYMRYGEPWWPGETLSASIGQSYNLITPLQACRMVGTICQGYRVIPFLIEGHPIERVVPSISITILERIKQAMRHAAQEGTGQALKNLPMMIYAKTGTAQTRSLSQSALVPSDPDSHAWFAAHVAYQDNEPFVLVVLLERAYTSRKAVEVAKNFLLSYKTLCDKHL
jgi:penicillin-binding protein 2